MTVVAAFREAMSSLASAVYVITGRDASGRPRGFTATAVLPHTEDPPSIVVSIDQSAFSHDALAGGDRFGVNLVAGDQMRAAEVFASKRPDKFEHVPWRWTEDAVPVLTDSSGYVVCRTESVVDHGDHTLLHGVIESGSLSDKTPLVYWRGSYSAGPPAAATPDQRRPSMPTATQAELGKLKERAREMLPELKERAPEAEQLRTMSGETMDDLREAGLLRLYQPARYGGYEMHWGAQVEIARILGRACGSTGWIAAVLATHSAMVGRMELEAQDEVWSQDSDALIATGSARLRGKAQPVDGGYLVDGAWRFASGIDHSQWVMVPAPVEGIEAEGPASLRQCLIPASEYHIVDDWHVSGLGGTGSKQVALPEPVFVPAHRTIGFLEMLGAEPPGADVNDGYVYRIEFRPYFGTLLLGPILGSAEGALDDYLEATRTRMGAIFADRVADSLPVQLRVAQSSAEIGAAGLVVDRVLDVLHDRGAAGQALASRERVESMRDRAFVARSCVDAVHRLVRQMGATGLSDDNPVQRHFRDLSAMAAQVGLNWDRNASTYGKWALGIPTGDRAIDGETSTAQRDPSDTVG